MVSELKIREEQCYKAYYCGVCREIGKAYGQAPRFGLTHEFAVLAMVLSCCIQHNQKIVLVRRPCIAHPFRKRLSYGNNPFIAYAAAMNVLFVQGKLKDNWVDEKKISALSAQIFFYAGSRKARKKYGDLHCILQTALEDLGRLEKAQCISVDEIAHPFANLIGKIFTIDGLVSGELSKSLYQLGYHLGKWIYLADAVSDRERDRKKKNYNVYNLRYGSDPVPETEQLTRELSLSHIAEAWEQLKRNANEDTASEQGYLDNLFYLGLRAQEDKLRQTERGGDAS